MINFFNGQKKTVMVQNKGQEDIVITIIKRVADTIKSNHTFFALLSKDTKIANGDIIIDNNDKYFVVNVYNTYLSVQAKLYKANSVVQLARIVKHFTNGVQDGFTETIVAEVPSLQETITANMKQFDAGLLPSTVKRFLLPKVDVRLQDRIKLGSENYQVDSIDDTTYANLLYVQCSIDKRVVK